MSHLQSIIDKYREKLPHLTIEDSCHCDFCKQKGSCYRPITLQDILLAMGPGYSITCGGLFFMALPGDGYERPDKLKITNIRYDLTKSPYDQSEEVLEFISKTI